MHSDLRLALRQLAKTPAFASIAVVTLALGIGANTAIFSVVHALLLSPLPYEQPGQLVNLSYRNQSQGGAFTGFAPADFRKFEQQTQSFEKIAASRYDYAALTGVEKPTQITGGLVTAEFFNVLGVKPVMGRTFLPDDLQPDRTPGVVISRGFWERHLGSNRDIIGSPITLDGESHIVIGVMPASFKEPFNVAELWRLFPAASTENSVAVSRFWGVLAKMKPGVSIEAAQTETSTIQQRLAQDNAGFHEGWEIVARPLRDVVVGSYKSGLLLLVGASGLVLLITCANVAGLILVRAAGRTKELAVRTALGAGRWRLVRQQLAESILLLIAGSGAGLLLGSWGLDLLLAGMPDGYLPRGDEVRLSMPVLGICVTGSLVIGLLFSLLPAWKAARVDAADALKDGAKGSTGPASSKTRAALVVGQIALAIVLLTSAGLVLKSFDALVRTNPGIRPDNILSMVMYIPTKQYDNNAKQVAYYRQITDTVGAISGVESVALTQTMPFVWGIPSSFKVAGREDTADKLPQAFYDSVTPSFFPTMGVPLIAGRTFTDADNIDAARVVVISQSTARRFFPNEDPVGRQLTLVSSRAATPMEIIGVVGDVERTGLGSGAAFQVYSSINQRGFPFATLLVKSPMPVEALTRTIRSEIGRLNPDQPISDVATVRSLVDSSIAQPRLFTVIFGLFAVLALLLSALGLYGLIAYGVSERYREFGIRTALGANAGDLLLMILAQGGRLTAIGVAIGLAAALGSVRLMESLLYQTGTYDPLVFAGVIALLAVVALGSSLLPARRATKVDPMVALRSE